jgi:hypothetical protein
VAGQLLSLLSQRPRLIVSPPQNSPDLARAAADGGADALKVHLNVTHEASGTRFGSLAEEHAALDRILAVGLPTGIVPGVASSLPSPADMGELAHMGLDFFDLYAHDMPAWMMDLEGMTRTVALSDATPLAAVPGIEPLGFEMVEAAVVPHSGYGLPLSVADLLTYRQIRAATRLPIIVPTQRAIRPEEVSALVGLDLDAVMIGAIVTGREPASLRAATERFAASLAAVAS